MDKRTVWGLKGGDDPIICHCLDKPRCQDLSHCTEYVLVTPSDLAKVEVEAAKVAMLTEAMVKKDEVIKSFLIVVEHGCLPGTCGNQLFGDLCDLDDTDCIPLGVVEFAKHALSLTPTSVTQHAEDVRIGRDVVALRNKWNERFKHEAPTRGEETMFDELHHTIITAIAHPAPGAPHD